MKMADEAVTVSDRTGLEVAVIGMAGRFPGAKNIQEFWNNLKNGVDSISFFSDRELEEGGIDPVMGNDPAYVNARGVLEGVEYFDAAFFNCTPAEAKVMDPQGRVFHECAWGALEDAGYDPGIYDGKIGVYAGASTNFNWWAQAVLSGVTGTLDTLTASHLLDKDCMPTRVSFNLNLRGPSFSVQTACSTSLVAIHLACQGLLTGECGMALAGGVTITIPQTTGYMYKNGMVNSPDGHCRAFDAKALGFAGGNGAGVVVLKLLEDAAADGDNIYAVIKASAVNNDGNQKVGFTAPGIKGQAGVIKAALNLAEVEPESIGYIETHGTGTPLGDPIEIESLTRAFNTNKKGFCKIGSAKTNVGHLDAAAGVTGFIKTLLALKHRQIPPSLHFKTPNPRIDFENNPFSVNTRLTPWGNGKYPRRAGVSAFGIGGTNAHVILEEWPENGGRETEGREHRLLLLSAKTPSALDKMTANLVNELNDHRSGPTLADIVYTLQVGRKAFNHRRMVVCSDRDEAVTRLSDRIGTYTPPTAEGKRQVVFMFAGLGSQYVDMGRELYDKEAAFREETDRCFKILASLLEVDLKEIIYPFGVNRSNRTNKTYKSYPGEINRFEIAQLVIFVLEYALSKLLIKWGIQPDAMIGYSFGEYTAACISGVLSLEDALRLIVRRGELMAEAPKGAMLSVPLSKEELTPLLDDELSIAIDNGSACIAAGPEGAVASFEKAMKKKKLMCMPVPHSVAMHSKLMGPILSRFEEELKTVTLNPPQIPYVSNVTGTWIDAREVVVPAYWSAHLRKTVRFAEGLRELVKMSHPVFIEIGPGRDLSTMAQRFIDQKSGQQVTNLIRPPQKNVSDVYYLLNKIGRLWGSGVNINWPAFYSGEKRNRTPLPTYPFEGKRFWFKRGIFDLGKEMKTAKSLPRRKADTADWFYIPQWNRSFIPPEAPAGEAKKRSCWLLFLNDVSPGPHLAERLIKENHTVIVVRPGDACGVGAAAGTGESNVYEYTVNPREPGHYDRLFNVLAESGNVPDHIAHLWGLTGKRKNKVTVETLDSTQDMGLYSLLNIAQAVGNNSISKHIQLGVVTDGMQPVTGEENPCPEKATVLGPVKVIPLEYPNIRCRSIDIVNPGSDKRNTTFIINNLLAEFSDGFSRQQQVAYRGTHRWVESFEPVRLNNIPGNPQRLKEKGIYLVTGGFGGMGFALVEHLAKTLKAGIILVDILNYPGRKGRDKWLFSDARKNDIRLKMKKINELEKMGAEIAVHDADVSDFEQMKDVISKAKKRFGRINGVIHTAGLIDYAGIIQRRTRETTEELLAAKVRGTLILDELLKTHRLDFMVLFSSSGNIFYKVKFGQVGYNAGHEFLDVFTYRKQKEETGTYTVTIDWNDWLGVGMGARTGADKQPPGEEPPTNSGEHLPAISPSEGIEAFNRILGGFLPRAVVSPHDLNTMIEFMNNLGKEIPGTADSRESETVSETWVDRPELSASYKPPATETQRIIARIWEKFFGIRQVGVEDDFFELGGDSLKAMNVSAIIRDSFDIEIPPVEFFNRQSVEGIARYIDEYSGKSDHLAVNPVEEREYYPVSSAQRRLYVLQQLGEENTTYNEQSVTILEGDLVIEKWEEMFKQLVKRHEGCRTSFEIIKGEPVQEIHKDVDFGIEYFKVEGKEKEKEVERIIQRFIKPFDLSQAPLLRVGLIRMEKETHVLIIDMHHIIMDGTSHTIFINDLVTLYQGRELPPLRVQYKDFAHWQNSLLKSGEINVQEEFWLKEFEGELPVSNLPLDFPRPPLFSFEGSHSGFQLDESEEEALRKIAAAEEVTLYMIFLALFNIFLARLTDREDIVVGTLIAGRRHREFQQVMGMFVNTLALRNYPRDEKTFPRFLKDVREKTLGAYGNQDYQFETLVEKVVKERDTSRNPLFDVMFLYHNMEAPEIDAPGLKLKPYRHVLQKTKFDLRFDCNEQMERMGFFFEYSTRLFREETILRFINYFRKVVSTVIKNPAVKIRDIEIIGDKEKERLLYTFNDTRSDYPQDKTLHQLFEEQVYRTPDGTALHMPHTSDMPHMTYGRLNRESSQLARMLRKKGVGPDVAVGITARRSMEAVVGIMGILKAGGAYLPIDPEYPEERIKYMLADSGAKILLTAKDIAASQISPGDNKSYKPDLSAGAGNLAYIIYTSGSTGKPRGVMLEHRNVVNYISWAIKSYIKEEKVNFPLFTSLSFDLTVTSIFTPLLSGNAVVVYGGDGKESLIQKVIEDNRVGVVKLTPSHLRLIAEASVSPTTPSRIKRFIVGGEALETALVKKITGIFKNNIVIYNEYGPTETAVGCMIHPFSLENDTRRSVPIGTPAANVQIYLLDKNKKTVPVGVAGEMHIAGDGVARGYLNNPELTAERFSRGAAPSKFLTPLYRTGDLARHLPGGGMEFLGRIDQQVKIRGFRIEPEEIRAALTGYRKNRPGDTPHKDIQAGDLIATPRCKRCLLPIHYPGIRFDQNGICNTCLEYDRYKENVANYFKTGEDFLRLVRDTPKTGRGEYDCLLLFSGGKDSTYVLHQLIDMGLKVLTFTFDNGYISGAAFDNIKRTTSALNVEHIACKAGNMNKVFVESLNTTHDVCHGCWNALNTYGAKIAREKGINLVISGLSRGQIFEMRLEELFRQGVFDEEEVEQNLLLFRKSFHSKSNKFSRILDAQLTEEVVEQIRFVDFFRYFDTPVSDIRAYLAKKGWIQPEDTGFCSSNCIINDVGIYMHILKNGFHFYEPQLSWDCRLGTIPRETGLKEIAFEGNWRDVNKILIEIGYYEPPIKDAVVIDREGENNDKILTAYLVSDDEMAVPELREYLAARLPDYMIPSEYIQVEKIPLTTHGKVDGKALNVLGKKLGTGVEHVAPTTDQEVIVAGAWKEILKLDDVGIHDNFFDLGGTSVDVIRLNKRITEILERDFPLVTMYKYTTIASFSHFLENGETGDGRQTGKRVERIERGRSATLKRREKRTRRKE